MAPEHQICGLRNDWESSPYVYLAWQELYVFWNLFGFSRMILSREFKIHVLEITCTAKSVSIRRRSRMSFLV